MKRKKWIIILCLALAIFIALPTLLVIKKSLDGPITLEPPDTSNSINIGDSDTEKPADSNSPDDTEKPADSNSPDDTDNNSGDIIEPEIYGVYGSEGIDSDSCTYVRSVPVSYYDLKENYHLQFSMFYYNISEGFVCVKVNPDYISAFHSYHGDDFLFYSNASEGVYILYAHSMENVPDITLDFTDIDESTAQSIEYIADLYLFEPVISGQWELPETIEQCLPYEYDINFTVYKGALPGSETNEFDSFDISSNGDCYFGDLKVGSAGSFLDTYFIDFGEEPQACDIYFYVWFWTYACNLNLV